MKLATRKKRTCHWKGFCGESKIRQLTSYTQVYTVFHFSLFCPGIVHSLPLRSNSDGFDIIFKPRLIPGCLVTCSVDLRTSQKLALLQLRSLTSTVLYILRQPVRIERQKTGRCFSSMSGSIAMTVTIPKSGYCIGEIVPLQVNLVNGSNQEVRIAAVIEERIDFIVKDRRIKYNDHRVVRPSAWSDLITPQANLTWSPQDALIIHQSTPPTLNAIIIIRYFM